MEEETLLLDLSIKKIEMLYRCAGVNLRSGEQNPRNFKAHLIFWVNFNSLIISYIGSIVWLIDGIRNGKDFLEITELAPCISLSSCALFKGMIQHMYEKHVHKLVKILRRLEKQGKKRPQSLIKDTISRKEKKKLEATIDKLNALFTAVVISFSTSPLVVMAVKYYQSNVVEPILPILITYPFDSFNLKIWPFVFVHQIWSECIVTLYISTADFFFFTCCTYINIQFRLLQEDIQNIIPPSKDKVVEDVEFRKKLKDLINWHQDLIESANILEIIYSKPTLINFMSSCLIICLAGFNLTVFVTDITFIAKFVSFLTLGLVQIFFLCFFADILTTSSMGVSEAVYNSSWYTTEAKIGKDLLLILTRAQRPCKITACGFADVDLNSFMRVLSTSYSYFALLQTMYAN